MKRRKNLDWQSADGRVISDHIRVTVQRLFSKKYRIAWNVEKSLFDRRPTVAWPPTTVTWPFSDFFQKISNCLKRRKIVVWQSADGRVTLTTVAWPFSDFFQNFPKSFETSKKRFDSRTTVAWLSGYFASMFVSYGFPYASVWFLSRSYYGVRTRSTPYTCLLE